MTKKWGILIKKESKSLEFTGLKIPRDYQDLLEAIIALPNDIFYNTGIATYIWVLSNKKAGTVREGKVQLINANEMYAVSYTHLTLPTKLEV